MAKYTNEFDFEFDDLGWRMVAFEASQDHDAEMNAGPVVVCFTRIYDDATGKEVTGPAFETLVALFGEQLRELALDTMQSEEELRQERIASTRR